LTSRSRTYRLPEINKDRRRPPAEYTPSSTWGTVESVSLYKAPNGAPVAEFSGHECIVSFPDPARVGDAGRSQAAIFSELTVLGFQRLEYVLTEDAMDLGLDAGLPAVMELGSQIGEFGRGERI
jgi:hypothetical protein